MNLGRTLAGWKGALAVSCLLLPACELTEAHDAYPREAVSALITVGTPYESRVSGAGSSTTDLQVGGIGVRYEAYVDEEFSLTFALEPRRYESENGQPSDLDLHSLEFRPGFRWYASHGPDFRWFLSGLLTLGVGRDSVTDQDTDLYFGGAFGSGVTVPIAKSWALEGSVWLEAIPQGVTGGGGPGAPLPGSNADSELLGLAWQFAVSYVF